ncbi:MAG: xylulokinase [Streptosporangiales bacterium]|nr:xylulokinase [Streptosporangiales bacterium]
MSLVAGVDSSTQSCKVVLVDAETGDVRAQASASHPDATEVDPAEWWRALGDASASTGLWESVQAVSIAAQQHGMVALDDAGAVVRPALLWNDTRSADQARALVEELGAECWATNTGSVPTLSFTVTKLAWLREHEPAHADRVASVLLPHDWLGWRLLGRSGDPATDRSDASGTGYWSPVAESYRTDLVERALGKEVRTPRVAGPSEPVGRTDWGALVGAGAGDNAAAALGLQAAVGDVVVSVGTSGTVFATNDRPTSDPTGIVAGFADAAGGYLPLVCTLNATRVLDATATLLGVDHEGLDRLALQAPPTADGLALVPYLEGERTPNLPDATGSLFGLTRATMTPAHLARAAVLGVLCSLADGLAELRRHGVEPRRVVLIGGGARSEALRTAAPEVFGLPVTVPSPGEYVAIGAARQAAWVLSGAVDPPQWTVRSGAGHEPAQTWGEQVRDTYREAKLRAHPDA